MRRLAAQRNRNLDALQSNPRIMNKVFWAIVAVDAAIFVALLVAGLAARVHQDGGREMGLIFGVILPGIFVAVAVLLHVLSKSLPRICATPGSITRFATTRRELTAGLNGLRGWHIHRSFCDVRDSGEGLAGAECTSACPGWRGWTIRARQAAPLCLERNHCIHRQSAEEAGEGGDIVIVGGDAVFLAVLE